MSLFPEPPRTAKAAADKFVELMRERPCFWAENVAEATEHLKEEKEQIDFLRFMADPKGVTPGRNANPKLVDVKTDAPRMEDHPDYELLGVVPGKMPTYKVRYRPRQEVQDEKVDC